MHGPLNMLHTTLACALGLESRIPDFRWKQDHSQLAAWFERVASRPSFVATALPVSR